MISNDACKFFSPYTDEVSDYILVVLGFELSASRLLGSIGSTVPLEPLHQPCFVIFFFFFFSR
jgi:hypothetical protein